MQLRFECKNLSKCFNKGKKNQLQVLKTIDYKIYDGCYNALVGRSGSGKSTLARILLMLDNYDSGSLTYKTRKIETLDKYEFRKKNQLMFQNPFLAVNPRFRIGKIIAEPLKIQKKEKSYIDAKTAELCELLKLDRTLLQSYPDQVSGGEIQRIVLARSLILEPEFLILDEPFSALDEIQANKMMRFFRSAIGQLKTSILFISHRLDRVKYFADYTCELRDGQIIELN